MFRGSESQLLPLVDYSSRYSRAATVETAKCKQRTLEPWKSGAVDRGQADSNRRKEPPYVYVIAMRPSQPSDAIITGYAPTRWMTKGHVRAFPLLPLWSGLGADVRLKTGNTHIVTPDLFETRAQNNDLHHICAILVDLRRTNPAVPNKLRLNLETVLTGDELYLCER